MKVGKRRYSKSLRLMQEQRISEMADVILFKEQIKKDIEEKAISLSALYLLENFRCGRNGIRKFLEWYRENDS